MLINAADAKQEHTQAYLGESCDGSVVLLTFLSEAESNPAVSVPKAAPRLTKVHLSEKEGGGHAQSVACLGRVTPQTIHSKLSSFRLWTRTPPTLVSYLWRSVTLHRYVGGSNKIQPCVRCLDAYVGGQTQYSRMYVTWIASSGNFSSE